MSLNLEIDKQFSIKADKMNFILDKIAEVIDKKTQEVKLQPKEIGYYWDLEKLLYRCLMEKIRDSKSETIEELINEIKEFKEFIGEVVKRENITLKDFQNESV